ncbi:MAG TPA: winged helix DNA-binding domain-containing protein [Ktedonobacterales bacterium]|nr:winged helix DNA-binding domain-containing protein [Ktedonobacterales bacterium]
MMATALSPEQARTLRLCAQRLTRREPDAVMGAEQVTRIVQHLCGVQAQYEAAAALAARVRGAGLVAGDIEQARVDQRTLVRTWLMRGTLHLVTSADLGWLLPLLGPVFAAGGRRRRLQLGLDDDTAARGLRLLRDALAAHGPLTRTQIVEQLDHHGLRLAGQARPHLIALAAQRGILCHGPDRADGEPAYALLDDWLPERGQPLPPAEALAALARRYLAAYGPAGVDDLAAWSGLPVSQAHDAWHRIAGELLAVEIAGRPASMLAAHAARLDEPADPTPSLRLLAGYDPYLLGYRSRELAVAPVHARHIHPGGGVLHPTLLVDGRALGTWRTVVRLDRLEMIVAPFAPLPATILPALAAEAADVGRFLGLEATLRVEEEAGG